MKKTTAILAILCTSALAGAIAQTGGTIPPVPSLPEPPPSVPAQVHPITNAAQKAVQSMAPTVQPPSEGAPVAPVSAEPVPTPPPVAVAPPPPPPSAGAPAPNAAPQPVPQGTEGAPAPSVPEGSEVVDSGGSEEGPAKGTWVREMAINDLLQVLSRRLGLQYFYNPALANIKVSGSLLEVVPSVADIKAMAYQYDVLVDANGRTLVAYSRDQLGTLPKKDYIYTLKYLRPNTNFNSLSAQTQESGQQAQAAPGIGGVDFERLLRPAMSPTGAVTYEGKTNQLVISDNQYSLARVIEMLDRLDVPKKQVIVDVKILRLNSDASKYQGVDWAQTLGAQGLNIGVTLSGSIDQIFNTTPVFGSTTSLAEQAVNNLTGGTNTGTNTGTTTGGVDAGTNTSTTTQANQAPGIVLSPSQISFVIRALIENNVAKQESGPAVITEDNEAAMFSVVERIPIVEQTVTQGSGSGSNPTISTDVRYKIDKEDPSSPPAARREIGVSIAVTPSLLPDGTVRMSLLPRVATVTKYTRVYTGYQNYYNEYPNVNETSVEARARIPDGYTLVLGGYYQDTTTEVKNKVPFLGDIPGISYAFSSSSKSKIRSNIVFLITPTSYDPSRIDRSVEQATMMQQRFVEKPGAKYPDKNWPKEDSNPNLGQRIRNLWPFKKKTPDEFPLAADNPVNEDSRRVITSQQKNQEQIQGKILGTPVPPVE